MSTLQVTVRDGVLNKSTETFGKMENFVSIKVAGQTQEYRTRIVEGSAKTKKEENRISWNETLSIPIPSHLRSTAQLEVKVMDEDMTSNEVCAQGLINVERCGMLTPMQNEYVLKMVYPKEEKNNAAGELAISTRLV